MERFRRVARIWNWLPAFRGVAEHESIHKASQVLATSPSALSRTVKLLEEAVGVALFLRRGATMELTEDGVRLLAATRTAMRGVDEALPIAEGERARLTPIVVGVTSPVASAIVSLALADAHVCDIAQPSVVTVHEELATITELLLRGEVDLVVSPLAGRVADVHVDRLGAVSLGVYGARAHEASNASATVASLGDRPFVVREGNDGWPAEQTRRVVAERATLEGVLAFCATQNALTCLPDVVGARLTALALARVCDAGPAQVLYAFRRAPLESQDTRALDAIRVALEGCLVEPAPPVV